MEIACDMDQPIGYWIQQCRANGETLAVKVLHARPKGQAIDATDGKTASILREEE